MGPVFSFSLSSKSVVMRMIIMMMMMMLMMMSRYEVVEGGRVLSLSNYSTVSRRSHEMSRTQVTEVILLGSIS